MSEEDIARAIALSLRDAHAGPAGVHQPLPAPIDLEDDEAQFQAELQRAIEASKAADTGRRTASPATSLASLSSNSPPVTIAPAQSFLSERAQMEQARLARLKRLRGESEDVASEPPRKRQTPSDTSSTASERRGSSKAKGKSRAVDSSGMCWDGELRQTANRHVEAGRNGEDGTPVWRLSEIIGDKTQVSLAIISSYALNISWIYEFFAPETPVVIITQPAPGIGDATVKQVLPNWIRVTPFLRGGRGVVHMKFFLIFYKSGRLRIVISTANLIEYDWRDIENSVWVQDVSRRATPIAHDPKANDFPAAFERVLHALNVDPALTSFVHNDHPNIPLSNLRPGALSTVYDFSRVRVYLIPSIAGKHEGWPKVLKVGHTALMKAVGDMLDGAKKGKLTIECQGSSIGTYSTQWLNEFYTSASGTSPEKMLDEPKTRRAKLPVPQSIKILFPTHAWVQASELGEAGGGTMFCRRSQWEGVKFPRELFAQSKSKRGRVLMHSKMIIAIVGAHQSSRKDDSETEDSDDDIVVLDDKGKGRSQGQQQDVVGWAYVGSHNFTPSAWGTLSGSGFSPVMNITNYELGIAFPLHNEKDVDAVACYQRPPRKYGSDDIPWMQEESKVLNEHD
ncbi:phospholipase D/nuclease [Auriscalpium vulgare]|uniref:Phospholipase D/nuclease n=1 Tax=Auriscalpium vulgare TaxID=40419 RepID=A0ACB8RY28_9AGAM|nr:phospholipase D/nuclease [Auriscalpium vulgare]